MIAELHLHAPTGAPTQRVIHLLCELLREDNMQWVAGQVNVGKQVPLGARAAGIQYRPSQGAERLSPHQKFRSAPFMFWEGHGTCCEIAPYDAAVLTLLYDVPSRTMVPPQGGTSFHVNVLTPWGAYDPTHWWSRPNYQLPSLSLGKSRCQQIIRRLVVDGGRE